MRGEKRKRRKGIERGGGVKRGEEKEGSDQEKDKRMVEKERRGRKRSWCHRFH